MSRSAAVKMSGLFMRQLRGEFLPRGSIVQIRHWSIMSTSRTIKEDQKTRQPPHKVVDETSDNGDKAKAKAIVSYWGVDPPKISKQDGTPWRWNCFRPWETYSADILIDVKKHHLPVNFMDKFAYWTVQSLKYPTYLFFQRRHMCHSMLLETVAAVPGMVGGMLLHCKSLRRFEHSGGWIKALLEEAENERMHLMTFIELSNPKWYERALVFAVQGVFFNA